MADKSAPPAAPQIVLRDDTDGTAWAYSPADVPKGLALGLRHETPDEVKDRELRKWANDNPTLALAAAGARTLSFGATGLANSKEQAALKEAHPVLNSIGEFGSMLIPFAGEMGLASKAAKILSESAAVRNSAKVIDTVAKGTGLPMAGAAKVGGAVGKAIGGGAAAGVGRRALGTAAGLATESELYNIGANLGEAALGDEDLTADRLLAHSGTALALGAGLGFGGSLLASGVKAGASAALGQIDRMQRFISEELPKAGEQVSAAEAAKAAYTDAASAVSGMPKEKIDPFVADAFTPEGMARRERITQPITPEEQDKIIGAMFDDARKLYKQTKKNVSQTGYEQVVPAIVKRDLQRGIAADELQRVQEVFGGLHELSGRMSALPEEFDRSMASTYRRQLNEMNEAIFGRAENMAAGDGGRLGLKRADELFNKMLSFRQRLDGEILYGSTYRAASPAARKTSDLLKIARDDIAGTLRNPAVFGDAAALYAKQDAIYTRLMQAAGPKSEFMARFMTRGKIDSTKIKTFSNQVGTAGGTSRMEAFDEFLAAMRDINTQLADLADHVDVAFDRGAMDKLHTKLSKTRDLAGERLRESALIKQSAAYGTTGVDAVAKRALGSAAGAVVGGVLGGPVGAVAGAALQHGYNMLKDPVLAGRTLLTLEKINAKVDSRVGQTIKSFLGSATQAGKTAAKTVKSAAKSTASTTEKLTAPTSVFAMHHVLADHDLPTVRGDERDSVRMRDFRQLEALLTSLVTNPERAYDRYDQAFKVFRDAAPKLTDRLIQKQLESAQFLFSKLPKNPSAGKTLNDAINDWRPSDQDLAKFERYVKAANDPLSVLDDMQHGAITREGVDTLRTLYPSLYSSIQEHVLDNLANLQRRVPYTQRLNLSLLLNAPVDPSVTPAFVATMQGFYQGGVQSQVQGQQGGIAKAHGTGGSAIKPSALKSFNKASTLTTPQRIQFKSAL